MIMYNSGKIIFGIIIFIALFSAPFWVNSLGKSEAGAPELEYPKDHSECVRDSEWMKAYHMDLLNDWRDKVVREDIRFTEFHGGEIEMSLTRSCMNCHDNKEKFCDRCHNYLDVTPYCWDCHVEPMGAKEPLFRDTKKEKVTLMKKSVEAANEDQ
ncbi:MAG: sulfate reduction electron transfer complex DsrMKJOP subunit DsrJ [Candidatus Kapaibacterium sp.]